MNKSSARKIAISAIATAVGLIAIVVGYYVQSISLSMNVLAGLTLILPLSQDYHKESVLAYVAISALGAIFANIHILAFVLGSGIFTLISILTYKKKISTIIKIAIDIVWGIFVFWMLYELVQLITVDFSNYDIGEISKTTLYIILNAIFIVAFVLYDYLIIWIYRYMQPIISKIIKK